MEPWDRVERRREPRANVAIGAQLRRTGRAPEAVTVTSLSPHGCAFEPPGAAAVGDCVWLRLPGLQGWEARLVWKDGKRAGLGFARPLHGAVAARLATAG